MMSTVPTVREFLAKINIESEAEFEAPMSGRTSLGIGGPAEALVRPRDRRAATLLVAAAKAEGIPLFVLGGGANLLVGDRGIRGIVLDLSRLRAVGAAREAGEILVCEAGLAMDELCLEALCRGLAGLEDFAGMPGSVGGSVYMNARCYEREMSELLAWVDYLGPSASPARRPLVPGEWSYKRSPFQPGGPAEGSVVLAAAFRLGRGEPPRIASAMRLRRADREAKGHYRLPSAGSVFKNDRRLGRPTGRVLDELGLKGERIGGAMVSEWHANIFVNAGGATAADMLALIELARSRVRGELGAELELEVVLAGDF
jgi:UDP-N-acetylmuramate dehydrogenase